MDAPAPAPADHPPSPPVQSPLPPFKLERFFAKYEFHPTCTHHLCCSDAEPFTLEALLGVADADSLARYNSLSLAYTETAGLPALREAIAAQYTTLSAAEIVVAAPQELIFLAMTALLQPGDRIACTFPGYQSLFQVAKCVGCEVDLWEPRCDDKGQQWFDPQDLAALVQRGPLKVVVTNFPHNPTGFLPTTTQWQQIVHTCAGAGAELFSDEMYRGMEVDPARRLPAAADASPLGISLGGVSKAVGLPGLRIGWLATSNAALLARVMELKDYTTICNSAPSEVLALAAVRAWEVLAAQEMALVRANLATLQEFFGRWEGVVQWVAPEAGTVAFPRLLTGQPVAEFCEELADQEGVLLMPATVYDHAASVEEGRFRIGFGRRNLPECLDKVELALMRKGYRSKG